MLGASLVAQQQRICQQCRSRRRLEFHPWVGKIPWRRSWQPSPVFFPGESHEQRSLAGYSLLLLLLSRFSRVRLCATPQTAAYQAPRPWDFPSKNTGVSCHFLLQCMKVKSESEVAQSCPTLSDPMNCSPPGSSVRGIFQAKVLEWGAIPFSRLQSIGLQRAGHDWATEHARIMVLELLENGALWVFRAPKRLLWLLQLAWTAVLMTSRN